MIQELPGGRVRMQEASDAVTALGWRYVLGTVRTAIRVRSLAHAAEVAARVVAAAGAEADRHLSLDLRPDRVIVTGQTLAAATVTTPDIAIADRITAAVGALGLRTDPDLGGGPRSVQTLEIAIDAQDIPAVRPFWKAVLGYADEPGAAGPEDPIADPLGQGPAIWFQQMGAPRPQRNRIHFDISVPHDEAPGRIEAALAAGGRLLSDAEGNEACITTWQGRDP